MNRLRLFLIGFLLVTSCYGSGEMIFESVTGNGNILTAIFNKKLVNSGYLKQQSISIEYFSHIDLNALKPTILNIPFIMMIAPIAWFSGDTWAIDEMDYDLYESLEKAKSVLKFFYPKLKWDGKIVPIKLTKNYNEINRRLYDSALLFSSGVDSLATATAHADEKQLLINLRNLKASSRTQEFQKQVVSFARNIHADSSFVYSNYFSVINRQMLSKLCNYKWMTYIGFGMTRLGLAAPIAVYNKIPKLLISATFTPEYPEPYGSHPLIDNAFLIAGTQVFHDGAYNRSQKIYNIYTYCVNNQIPLPKIQVCMSKVDGTCLKCEQCLFTMNNILASELDPKLFGFELSNEETIKRTKKYLESRVYGICFQWIDLQKFVRNKSFNDPVLQNHFSWLLQRYIPYDNSYLRNSQKKAIFKDYFIRSLNGTFDYAEIQKHIDKNL